MILENHLKCLNHYLNLGSHETIVADPATGLRTRSVSTWVLLQISPINRGWRSAALRCPAPHRLLKMRFTFNKWDLRVSCTFCNKNWRQCGFLFKLSIFMRDFIMFSFGDCEMRPMPTDAEWQFQVARQGCHHGVQWRAVMFPRWRGGHIAGLMMTWWHRDMCPHDTEQMTDEMTMWSLDSQQWAEVRGWNDQNAGPAAN